MHSRLFEMLQDQPSSIPNATSPLLPMHVYKSLSLAGSAVVSAHKIVRRSSSLPVVHLPRSGRMDDDNAWSGSFMMLATASSGCSGQQRECMRTMYMREEASACTHYKSAREGFATAPSIAPLSRNPTIRYDPAGTQEGSLRILLRTRCVSTATSMW